MREAGHLDPHKKYRFSGEFGSLTLTGKLLRAPVVPELGSRKMADLLYLLWGVWEFGEDAPGARCAGTYPQVIHKLYTFREFGSLKLLDTDRGPRAFPRITRARDPRPFGQVPWFERHETV